VVTGSKRAARRRPFAAAWPLIVALAGADAAIADCVQTLHGDVFCGAGRCLVDRNGNVHCSKYYEGGARKTIHGKVLCGKGDCAKDINGAIFCSSEIGGAVFLDSKGYVHCYGKCEPASAANCEAVPADEADNDDSLEAKERQQED
jgi:hypothetical protein